MTTATPDPILVSTASAPRPVGAAFPPPSTAPAAADPDARHWIGGAWPTSARTLPSTDPATGDVLGTFADGGADEAAAAVASARTAFDMTDWARDPMARSRARTELADRVEERRDALSRQLTREAEFRASRFRAK